MVKDEFMLCGKKSASPVLDGLQMWLDAFDGVENPEYNAVSGVVTDKIKSCTISDRVQGNTIDFQTDSERRCLLTNSDGWFGVYSRETYGSSDIIPVFSGNITGIKTIEIVQDIMDSNNRGINIFGFVRWYDSFQILVATTSNSNFIALGKHPELQNTPAHCVVTFDDAKLNLYINGAFNSSVSSNGNTEISFDQTKGIKFQTLSNLKDKIVYRFASYRCYDRALTEEEIAQNYNYEKSLGRV